MEKLFRNVVAIVAVVLFVQTMSRADAVPPIFKQSYGYTNQNHSIDLRAFNNAADILVQISGGDNYPAVLRGGVVQRLDQVNDPAVEFVQAFGMSQRRDDGRIFVVGGANLTNGFRRAVIWDVAADGSFSFKIAPNIILPEDSYAPGEQPTAYGMAVNKAGVMVGNGVSYLATLAVRWLPPYNLPERYLLSTGCGYVDIDEDGTMLANGIEFDHGGVNDRYTAGIMGANGGITEIPALEPRPTSIFYPNSVKMLRGGWVIGNSILTDGSRAFAWKSGLGSILLPNIPTAPNAANTDGMAINSAGNGVGRVNGGTDSGAAIFWLNSSGSFTAYRFSTLLPAESFYYNPDNILINDAGQVVLSARDFEGPFVRIYDPVTDGVVQFTSLSGYAPEEAGKMDFVVSLTRSPQNSGAVTVNFDTADETAIAGVNYIAVHSSVTWAPGESGPKTISVPLIDNNTFDDSKTFKLRLTSVTGAQLAGVTEVDGYMFDNFQQLQARNELSTETMLYGVAVQRGQTQANILIDRIGGTDGRLTLTNFSSFDVTAKQGEDYQLPANLSVTWEAGDGAPKVISIPLLNAATPITQPISFGVTAQGNLEGASFPSQFYTGVVIVPSTDKTAPVIESNLTKTTANKLTFGAIGAQGVTLQLMKAPTIDGIYTVVAEAQIQNGEVTFSPDIATTGAGYFQVKVKP